MNIGWFVAAYVALGSGLYAVGNADSKIERILAAILTALLILVLAVL